MKGEWYKEDWDKEDKVKPSKEIKTGRRERFPRDEGKCECCGQYGTIFLTDDGDFCGDCLSKMSWLK